MATISKNTESKNNTKEMNTMEKKKIKNALKEELEKEESLRQKEKEEQEQEEKERLEKEELEKVEPIAIEDNIERIVNKEIRVVRDGDGKAIALNGGKLLQKEVNGLIIAASSVEELEKLEKEIKQGKQGDGKFHKTLFMPNMCCDCVGETMEDLAIDILEAKKEYKRTNGFPLKYAKKAEEANDAGYTKEDLKHFVYEQKDFFIDYKYSCVRDIDWTKIVDLDNIKSKLDKEDVENLLMEKLANFLLFE